jgi:hypothetical protein
MISQIEPKWDYDDEIKVEGITYYAQANYNIEHFHDSGDGIYTPPSSWINTELEPGALFFKENTETGDIDVPITEEEEPELYKQIYNALDVKVYELESER